MNAYRIVRVGNKFQAVVGPSNGACSAIVMGFSTEAEAECWLHEYLRLLTPAEPPNDLPTRH
jgi:hypothetical protein